MCFEFEWLYWAQLAQDDERRRKEDEEETRRAQELNPPRPQRPLQPEEQYPAHV